MHTKLAGELSPDPEAVEKALKRRGSQDAYADNRFGLTKQDSLTGSRDDVFWKNHNGIGLVWSNPNADDRVMIAKALLEPSFHLLLDIAARFGIDRLKSQWTTLQSSIENRAYPEEIRRLNQAKPVVLRSIEHMEEAMR